MADLNVIYSPTIDQTDADMVIAYAPGTWFWEPKRPLYLPDEVRASIRELNAQAISTANAVKVAYKGSTSTDRRAWVTERIDAIDKRLQFVKQRTYQLLDVLKTSDNAAYNTLMTSFAAATSTVPIIGSVIGAIVGSNQAAQKLEQTKLQILIREYQNDAEQLIKIRQELVKEYQGNSTITTTEPTSQAPAVSSSKYVLIGVALLALIFIIIRSQNS